MKNITLIISASLLLIRCDAGNSASAKQLADKSVANMVTVKGGEFLMGDFWPAGWGKITF